MQKISKTIFTFTVLHPSDETFEDIESAMYEARTGNAVGNVTDQVTHSVNPEDVKGELTALGNDGLFFEEI